MRNILWKENAMDTPMTKTEEIVRKKTPLVQWIPFILLAVGTYFLYHKAMQWWYFEWTADGSYYSHAIFIPFFVVAILWRRWGEIIRLPVKRSWWGVLPILLAAILIVYSGRAIVTVSMSFSFMFFILGVFLLTVGTRITRALIMPLIFTFSVIPIIPNQVIGQAAFPIQLTSTVLATHLLKLLGFTAERVGTSIQMDNYSLNVEVACSGFKTLIGLLSFAGAFAYLIEGAVWKRVTLFIITAPLSILVNGLRIMLIGVVGELISSQAAGTFHDYSGFIVLVLAFMFLFGFAKLMQCESFLGLPIVDDPSKLPPKIPPEEREKQLNAQFGEKNQRLFSSWSFNTWPILLVTGLLILLEMNIHPLIANYPLLQPSDIPAKLANGWYEEGPDIKMTKVVFDTLEPDTYLERDYINPTLGGASIDLFFTGGNSRHTFHDPHDCFSGSGLILKDLPVEEIQTSVGPVPVQVSEAKDPFNGAKSLIMFVYIVNGRPEHTMAHVQLTTAIDALLGKAVRPYYFIRFQQRRTGIGNNRKQELVSFVKAVWPYIAPKVLAPH